MAAVVLSPWGVMVNWGVPFHQKSLHWAGLDACAPLHEPGEPMSDLNRKQESTCQQYGRPQQRHCAPGLVHVLTIMPGGCKKTDSLLMQSLPRLPQDFRSRLPSWPDERKKSIRFESSSSDGILLRRRLKLPFGVTSETVSSVDSNNSPLLLVLWRYNWWKLFNDISVLHGGQ
jgi:hypothetical protein